MEIQCLASRGNNAKELNGKNKNIVGMKLRGKGRRVGWIITNRDQRPQSHWWYRSVIYLYI